MSSVSGVSGGGSVSGSWDKNWGSAASGAQFGQEVEMAGGKVSSSKVDMLHLIPTDALTGLADRFAVGSARKGDKAWNATTKNHEALEDREFLLERVSHVIRHALLLRDQIVAGRFVGVDGAGGEGGEGEREDSFYENAGAVAFGGALMLCAAKRLERLGREKDKRPAPVTVPSWAVAPAQAMDMEREWAKPVEPVFSAVTWGGKPAPSVAPQSITPDPPVCPKPKFRIGASQLESGKSYACRNNLLTGTLGALPNKKFFSRLPGFENIVWTLYGTAESTDVGMDPKELVGYFIVDER